MVFNREDLLSTVEYLSDAMDVGFDYLAYPRDRPVYTGREIEAFKGKRDAEEFADFCGDWYTEPLVPFLEVIEELACREYLPEMVETGHYYYHHKYIKDMNLNNLEDLRDEMKGLGFGEAQIAKMEEHMKNNEPFFRLYDEVKAERGQVDITLHFKQSGQSDYYYLNRLEAVHNQRKPLGQDEKYIIITRTPEGQENGHKKMENLAEAIEHFKKQKGNVELAVGKSPASKTMLANMEEGKVNYIARDFSREFNSPPIPQTFWLDHGKGFSREQAANLVQGRSVYRDDLLSREGVPYKAWMILDTEKPRDRNNNLKFRPFNENYFNIKQVLDEYKIKELADPKKAQHLLEDLQNGGRPLVTSEQNGKEVKVFVEVAARWGKLNFTAENGKPEKREQFQKETGLEMGNVFNKKAEQQKDKAVSQGIDM